MALLRVDIEGEGILDGFLPFLAEENVKSIRLFNCREKCSDAAGN